MTNKKTIVFAPLVTAILLLFSSMGVAEAQKAPTTEEDPRIQKLQEMREEISNSKAKKSGWSQEERLTLERIDLTIQYIQQKNLGFPNQTLIDEISLAMQNNIDHYDLNYTKSVPIEQIGVKKSALNITSFRTASIIRHNCDTQNRDFGIL